MKPSRINTIGILAPSLPSFGKRRRRVEAALSAFQKAGLRSIIGESVFARRSYRSADIATRVQDLMSFFQDHSLDCIFMTTGGYNSNEMLEYLDYESILANPKWLVGYSDVTALNLAIYARTGLSTVSGPMLVDHVDDPTAFSRCLRMLESSRMDFSAPKYIWDWNRKNKRLCPRMRYLEGKKVSASGRVIAGNLSTFVLLLGTPYFPDCSDTVLFLEYDECETDGLPSIQRMLWQIRQSGVLAKISGMVMGALPSSTAREEKTDWALADILTDVTNGFDFPVLFDAPFGHIYPSWFFINGKRIRIDCKRSGLPKITTILAGKRR